MKCNFSVDLPVLQGTSCVFLEKNLMKLHLIGLTNLNLRYVVFVLKYLEIYSLDAMDSITYLQISLVSSSLIWMGRLSDSFIILQRQES